MHSNEYNATDNNEYTVITKTNGIKVSETFSKDKESAVMELLKQRDEILKQGTDNDVDVIECDRNDRFILQYGNGTRIEIEIFGKERNTPYIELQSDNEDFIPIGMADGNLYYVDQYSDLEHTDINKRVSVSYYRPVSKENLDDYRSKDSIREYYRQWWAEAAKDGYTDLSLDDYIEQECDNDTDNPEWFPNYDEGVAENVNSVPDLRRIADLYAQSVTKERVGTWEWGGCGYLEKPFDVIFSHKDFAYRLEREAGFRR